jgi:hypothetical protein
MDALTGDADGLSNGQQREAAGTQGGNLLASFQVGFTALNHVPSVPEESI